MSAPERVWLIQTPSSAEAGWRDALSRACADRGWDFLTQLQYEAAPQGALDRPSLTAAWLNQTGDQVVSRFLVQYSTPWDSEAVLLGQGRSPHDALHEASLRFATADLAVRNGAGVSHVSDEILSAPGLGDIARPGGATAPASIATHPLDIYARGPVSIGAQAHWGPELFGYPDLDGAAERNGVVQLLGRRRLLFNGPNIFLPPGRWRFQAEFSIDPGGVADLLIEWGHGYDVQALPVKIDRPGRYELDLSYAWKEVAAADFRISLMTPMLGGVLEFGGGTVSRTSDEAPAEASTVAEDDED